MCSSPKSEILRYEEQSSDTRQLAVSLSGNVSLNLKSPNCNSVDNVHVINNTPQSAGLFTLLGQRG